MFDKDSPSRAGCVVFAATVAVVFLVVIGVVGQFAFDWFTAGPRGELEARQQILSGDNRIQAYDHFFDLCASVQAVEASIDQTLIQLDTPVNQDDTIRLRTNLNGQQATRARAISQYNVDARKSYTVGQFRSLSLPYQLPTDDHQKGERTSCEAF